jgi:hypothetical protein
MTSDQRTLSITAHAVGDGMVTGTSQIPSLIRQRGHQVKMLRLTPLRGAKSQSRYIPAPGELMSKYCFEKYLNTK